MAPRPSEVTPGSVDSENGKPLASAAHVLPTRPVLTPPVAADAGDAVKARVSAATTAVRRNRAAIGDSRGTNLADPQPTGRHVGFWHNDAPICSLSNEARCASVGRRTPHVRDARSRTS